MPVSRLEYLFNCYINDACSDQEEEELMWLLAQSENETAVKALIDRVMDHTGSETQLPDDTAATILQTILQEGRGTIPARVNKKIVIPIWMRIAAVLILMLSGIAYWLLDKKEDGKAKMVIATKDHLQTLPVRNGAMLTFSNGTTILLDSLQNGVLQQGNTLINKNNHLLVYHAPSSTGSGSAGVYNTLSTPKGGQYQVVLTDGSKIWLNAASSLHYPTAFKDSVREVELTGEAYFEVAKNKNKPFRVKVGSMWVDVLGTHFNINAYNDGATIKTSLLEGSIKLTEGNTSKMLKPGQQAVLNKNENQVKITSANMDEVVAWKNGWFQFEGADITSIMRQIGRWYDVEVVYAGKVPTQRFEGKISRDAQLSEVLRILELSNVRFTVIGKKIIVQ